MQKTVVCAVILGILVCAVAHAGNIDCVKYLHFGDKKVCMKILKETSPSLAAEINDTVYYAATTNERRGGLMFEYDGNDYSVYNTADTEYELIHWLSGTDALVDGVWRDRIAIDGAMNFTNYGCTWNDEHDGYYSANGRTQYFRTASVPKLDFGTDWYAEITAQIGTPAGTWCYFVDFASVRQVGDTYNANGLGINKDGRFHTNTKINGNSNVPRVSIANPGYTFGSNAIFTFGVGRYSANQSRAFVTFDGNRYYGTPYDTVTWNRWDSYFYLFSSFAASEGVTTYQCGPTTIYDIKIWRKK